MACCEWKRSKNDALYDLKTQKMYCGTCWQLWFSSRHQRQIPRIDAQAVVDRNQSLSQNNDSIDGPDNSLSDAIALVIDDETLHPLETRTHIDGNDYLVSKSRRLVFEMKRYAHGKLKCVGDLTPSPDDQIKLFKVTAVASTVTFPFIVSSEDHCETPQQAYDDLAPVLHFVAYSLNKTRATLRIWDPYYCAGSVKGRLSCHGFKNVYNECVDFYQLIRSRCVPKYDVIVTNPPYSTSPIDHICQLLEFLATTDKPWFVVQPNFVYTKQYWVDVTSKQLPAPRPFFLTPSTPRRYKYKTPCGLRQLANAQRLNTSPFVTFWYCWLGPSHTHAFYEWLCSNNIDAKNVELTLACAEYFLPDAFKDSNDKTRRKKKKVKGHMVKDNHNLQPAEIVYKNIKKKKNKKRRKGGKKHGE